MSACAHEGDSAQVSWRARLSAATTQLRYAGRRSLSYFVLRLLDLAKRLALWGIKPFEQTRQDFSGQELLLEGRKVAPPNGNCPSTTLNDLPVDPPRLHAPMPTVHHHVTDEAQMEPIGDVLPKWLGVILSVRIDRLRRLPARTAVKGARNRARPPLSIKPGLCPTPLLTTETVIGLQSVPLRLMDTNYTRI
jgi:hypothetical protein